MQQQNDHPLRKLTNIKRLGAHKYESNLKNSYFIFRRMAEKVLVQFWCGNSVLQLQPKLPWFGFCVLHVVSPAASNRVKEQPLH
jgi:hypothetical protein